MCDGDVQVEMSNEKGCQMSPMVTNGDNDANGDNDFNSDNDANGDNGENRFNGDSCNIGAKIWRRIARKDPGEK